MPTASDHFCETAYAKLNLALHIRDRLENGYHLLETLFAFADYGDTLNFTPANCMELVISGEFGAGLDSGDDNLILQSARAMQEHFGQESGARIHLEKHLPVAAGLGGGSADAAAVARGLAKLWQIDAREEDLIAAIGHLGADVPACILSRTIRGEGVGDAFLEVDASGLSGIAALIANPRVPLSTAETFKGWNGKDLGALQHGDVMAAALLGRNDLEPAAFALCPQIREGLNQLIGHHPLLARMSGSGASIFALYETTIARDAAADVFACALPDWWLQKASLI